MVVGEVNIVGEVSLLYRHVVGSDQASVFRRWEVGPIKNIDCCVVF